MSADWRRKLLGKLKRWCQERWPVPYPVRVYLRPASRMENHLGYFLYDEDEERGLIAIDASLQRNELIDTFLEEWAHARTSHLIDTEETGDDPWHHPSFWAEYGRLVKACRERAW